MPDRAPALIKQTSQPRSPAARAVRAPRPKRPTSIPQSIPRLGNQALQRWLLKSGTQAKLTVNEPGDRFEREADRIADTVLRMPIEGASTPPIASSISPLVQRQAEKTEEPRWSEILSGSLIQRQETQDDEDEAIQATALSDNSSLSIQREEGPDDEDEKLVQTKPEDVSPLQRETVPKDEEDEAVQAADLPDGEISHVQREKNSKEEDEPIQAQANPSTAVQRETSAGEEEEETLQASRTSPDRAPRPAPAAEAAIRSTNGGSPLPTSTRNFFEPRFGTSFERARVHTDDQAVRAARQVSARAFTHGRDIFFGAGQYHPETESGQRLLAHELTHTIQQGEAPSPHATQALGIQRADKPSTTTKPRPEAVEGAAEAEAAPIDPTTLPLETGRLNPNTAEITFSEIEIPAFKTGGHRGSLYTGRLPLRQQKAYGRGATGQREIWKREMGERTASVQEALARKSKKARGGGAEEPAGQHLFVAPSKFGRKPPRYFIGDLPTIASELTLPTWDKQGKPKGFDVDHIVELQLANWSADPWGNTLENIELLESSANRSSGSDIKSRIGKKVDDFIRVTGGEYGRSQASVKRNHHLVFNRVTGKGGPKVSAADYWTRAEIESGEHLRAVDVGDWSEVGGENRVAIFPGPAGGVPRSFKWPGDKVLPGEQRWLEPFRTTAKTFHTVEGSEKEPTLGSLSFNIAESDPTWRPLEGGDLQIPVQRIPGARFAGYVNKPTILAGLRKLRHKRMSPIRVDTFDISPDGGLLVAGQVLPDVPLLQDLQLAFELEGGEFRLYKEFNVGEFKAPPPFEVKDSSLVLFASTERGFGISGQVEFAVKRLGEGRLGATADTSGGFALEGSFDFDSSLFEPAHIELAYRDRQLSAEGTLGIPEGKVRGIRSAEVTAAYREGRFEASGTAELSVPGVKAGSMSLSYSEEEGFAVGGRFDLSDDIPGIQSGFVEANVRRRAEGEGYAVTAKGSAVPDIPGIDSSIDVLYDDGAFDVRGTAKYEKGIVRGDLLLGVTNQAVDAEGNRVGDPSDKLTAYGGGSVTVQIAPWLEGTVGMKLLPNGELEVSGEVALPSTLNVFEAKEYKREILSISFDIPIVGVSVLGQRIGIFVTIGGGLTLDAGIGPGQLRELGLKVTFNPSRPEETQVRGGAQLYVPAHAGLRLAIRAALGAGIPIVSASAGLEVGGELGLHGAASAGVQVNWTPTRGLVLDAFGEVFVEPKFRFDVTGFVLVEANLLLKTVELYNERWKLAAVEFGPDLRFGVKFPIHYEEGQPFDIDFSKVDFVIPDVDAKGLLKDLVKSIA
ncbi:DUF4157 domain-containing protein [Candidatus Bipolaricaulota bacterium]